MNNYVFEPVKPIVETKFGKLRGVTYGEVNIFMGVRYAEAKRFHMPVEQQPWEGVKNAYLHGPVAMLTRPNTPFDHYRGLKLLQNHSEDCQNLNIWAPKTLNGEKKPVFVWLHGGGYFAGNAMEEYSFDGFNLAHYGDVVFVSVNHRLNVVAHMNLADYGEEFANSVNAGIFDIVAALKWIHENIAAFGGDPDNVTIAGHSGGGGKVLSMYQIEEAAPYFARGIVLSGTASGRSPADAQPNSRRIAKAVMDELGITKENIEKVYEVPYEAIVDAVNKVTPELAKEGIRVNWTPVQNDYFYGYPVDCGFAPYSKDKPLLLGSVLGEFSPKLPLDDQENMTDEEKIAFLRDRFGADNADKLIELFKAAYPSHTNLLDIAYTDTRYRVPTMQTAFRHAEAGNNNTYNFLGAYNTAEDGRIPVWHGGEVCYMFMNVDKCYVLSEAIYGEKYTNIFSTMALNYMKTGNPNNKYLPEWKPVTTDELYTMVIDRECELRKEHDKEYIDLLVKVAPSPFR